MPTRSATIDEFPEIRDPNHPRIEKPAPNGPRPPLRRSTLTSRSYIRNDLHRRTGARIAPGAVNDVQGHLEDLFEALCKRSVAKYQTELDLRADRGANDYRLTFQPHHVVPPTLL